MRRLRRKRGTLKKKVLEPCQCGCHSPKYGYGWEEASEEFYVVWGKPSSEPPKDNEQGYTISVGETFCNACHTKPSSGGSNGCKRHRVQTCGSYNGCWKLIRKADGSHGKAIPYANYGQWIGPCMNCGRS